MWRNLSSLSLSLSQSFTLTHPQLSLSLSSSPPPFLLHRLLSLLADLLLLYWPVFSSLRTTQSSFYSSKMGCRRKEMGRGASERGRGRGSGMPPCLRRLNVEIRKDFSYFCGQQLLHIYILPLHIWLCDEVTKKNCLSAVQRSCGCVSLVI